MKIVLDAGHGFQTPGKRSPCGLREYEFNSAVARCMKESLSNFRSVSVYETHSDLYDAALKQRTDFANSIHADVFISIHANAAGNGKEWVEAEGIETYVYLSRPKEALRLAESVQKNLISATKLKNRGVKTADFHVLRETKMTAILVECGFMTSRKDIIELRSDHFKSACSSAIIKALRQTYQF
ncbi:N-acetylmuramoyl-L-alanine amidase [Peribacillus kribbensis]|uniref:N-acetylmuramoyl-L-alanine amidase n=1 Tax=Peribacillus kribbensis TaxID=356658 RepID=UPI000416B8E8|nr:N-acetylmuramoyl-L-alanine amidase [Peribacillus kribbensis]